MSRILYHTRVELQKHERAKIVRRARPQRPEDVLLRRVSTGVAELHRVVHLGHQAVRAQRRPEHCAQR